MQTLEPPQITLDQKERLAMRVGDVQSKKFEVSLLRVLKSVQNRTKGGAVHVADRFVEPELSQQGISDGPGLMQI